MSFFINRSLEKSKNKTESSKKHKELQKVVKISLIIEIVIISRSIIYYLLNPEPGFVTFGILNSEKRASGSLLIPN